MWVRVSVRVQSSVVIIDVAVGITCSIGCNWGGVCVCVCVCVLGWVDVVMAVQIQGQL